MIIIDCRKTKQIEEYPVSEGGCETGRWHSLECEVLASAQEKVEITDYQANCPLFSCITPLRMLLLRRTDPAAWRVVDTLMDHNDDRDLTDNPAWKVHLVLMVNFVQKHLRLDFTEAEIKRAIGILRTNSVREVGGEIFLLFLFHRELI